MSSTQTVYAGSFVTHDEEAGDWADDGPDSLSAPGDGKFVYWQAANAGFPPRWCDGYFGPPTPTGSDCSGIIFTAAPVEFAPSLDLELYDAAHVTVLASDSGSTIAVFDPDLIAQILAEGAILRAYGSAGTYTADWFSFDDFDMFLIWDGDLAAGVPRWPLRMRQRSW